MANYPGTKLVGVAFTVVCSHSPQNLKGGHFTLLFCRGRQINVPKCKTERFFLLIKPIVLRRCHCRHLSSLFSKQNLVSQETHSCHHSHLKDMPTKHLILLKGSLRRLKMPLNWYSLTFPVPLANPSHTQKQHKLQKQISSHIIKKTLCYLFWYLFYGKLEREVLLAKMQAKFCG